MVDFNPLIDWLKNIENSKETIGDKDIDLDHMKEPALIQPADMMNLGKDPRYMNTLEEKEELHQYLGRKQIFEDWERDLKKII